MNEDLVEHLKGGGIAIIRTDTLYGIVARAAHEAAVEQVFSVKSRDRDNPQGFPPATSIESARTYFKDEISTYVDGGIVPAYQPPSRIVKRMTDGSIVSLR